VFKDSAVDALNILEDSGHLDFFRCEDRLLICDEEINAIWHIRVRYLLHHCIADITDMALCNSLFTERFDRNELCGKSCKVVVCHRKIDCSVFFRYKGIVHCSHTVKDSFHNVCLCRSVCNALDNACIIAELVETILVSERHHCFLELLVHHLAGFLCEMLVRVVAVIDNNCEALVLCECELLNCVLEVVESTETICAVSLVIVNLNRKMRPDLDRLYAGKVVVCVRCAVKERSLCKLLKNLL